MAHIKHMNKTNAERMLTEHGMLYTPFAYDVSHEEMGTGVGVRAADALHLDPDACFKTLVVTSPEKFYGVCCIPSSTELDLKRAARVFSQKSLEILPISKLEQLTGYVRGGCSPIGMKRVLPTVLDETALMFDTIYLSGGRRGLSLGLNPEVLAQTFDFSFADIIRS